MGCSSSTSFRFPKTIQFRKTRNFTFSFKNIYGRKPVKLNPTVCTTTKTNYDVAVKSLGSSKACSKSLSEVNKSVPVDKTKDEMSVSEYLLSNSALLDEKYCVGKKYIGKGHYSLVFPGINRTNGKNVAIKRIYKSSSKSARLAVEVEILRTVQEHPNIVRLYDVYETSMEVQLVMEYLQGGELFESLIRYGPFPERLAAYHIFKLTNAIAYIHSLGIVHRDLKPENLLLTNENPLHAEIKLADFGLSSICRDPVCKMRTICGTWAYCAPEVKVKGIGYNAKVDLWSLGVIMYILLVAYHPFDPSGELDDDNMWELIFKAEYGFDDDSWDSISQRAVDLIQHLIMSDPKKRYNAVETLRHPWFDVINMGFEEPKALAREISRTKLEGNLCFQEKHMLFNSIARDSPRVA